MLVFIHYLVKNSGIDNTALSSGDKDVDIVIPHWLNTEIVRMYAAPERNCPDLHIAPDTPDKLLRVEKRLCGKTWAWWSRIFWPRVLQVWGMAAVCRLEINLGTSELSGTI
jgi:hypothetical protein